MSILFPYRADDGHRDRLFGWVLRWWQTNFPDAQICVGRNFDTPFNRGRARNAAFAESKGQHLIVADADTVPTAAGVRAAISDVVESQCWSIPYAEERYYNLSHEATTRILDKLDPTRVGVPIPEPSEDDYEHKITSWAGCLVMPREAWETVEGYDERFEGWGYEDNAFYLKLDRLWGPHRRQDSYCCHLWHAVAKGTTFDQPAIEHNRSLYKAAQHGNFE